jgi:hypothetical protein
VSVLRRVSPQSRIMESESVSVCGGSVLPVVKSYALYHPCAPGGGRRGGFVVVRGSPSLVSGCALLGAVAGGGLIVFGVVLALGWVACSTA